MRVSQQYNTQSDAAPGAHTTSTLREETHLGLVTACDYEYSSNVHGNLQL